MLLSLLLFTVVLFESRSKTEVLSFHLIARGHVEGGAKAVRIAKALALKLKSSRREDRLQWTIEKGNCRDKEHLMENRAILTLSLCLHCRCLSLLQMV